MSTIRAGRVRIPDDEIEVRAARATGPGGQGVNTTDSKVELRWDVRGSRALTETQRDRILERLASRLTGDGVLILRSQEHRSQHRNREAARARLAALVAEAVEPPRPRRATRPSRASRERRLQDKRARAELKRQRRRPAGD
jgi:ribosome-associated protein